MKYVLSLRYSLLLLGLLCITLSPAQTQLFQSYSTENGLPHPNVTCILQDDDGYLWMATYGRGLSRFDGINFTNFSAEEGLINKQIRAITKDTLGNIWVGAPRGGLSIFDGQRFTALGDSLGYVNDNIHTLFTDSKGLIWIGTSEGLYRYDYKKMTHFGNDYDLPEVAVMTVFEDSRGLIWVGYWESGLYCRTSPDSKRFSHVNGLSNNTITGIFEDSLNELWVSTFSGVNHIRFKGDQYRVEVLSAAEGFTDGIVYGFSEDQTGKIWMATHDKGVLTYHPERKQIGQLSVEDGLPGNLVRFLFRDREGVLWLSCWGQGVASFKESPFVRFGIRDGKSPRSINDARYYGNDLITSTNEGIFKFNGQQFEVIPGLESKDRFGCIFYDSKGVLWASSDKELFAHKDGKSDFFKQYLDIVPHQIRGITEDNNGDMWFASWGQYVTRYDGESFTRYNKGHQLNTSRFYTCFTDQDGRVWLGSAGEGVYYLDNNTFANITTADGLPHNYVSAIEQDHQKNMWFGTDGGGIAMRYGERTVIIDSRNGLSSNHVTQLKVDKAQNLWIGTINGLNRLDLKEFLATGTINIRHYGEADGFMSSECLGNNIVEDQFGQLWFGTRDGLYLYQFEKDADKVPPPGLVITNLQLNFKPVNWNKMEGIEVSNTGLPINPELKHSQNHVTFQFTGISTSAPEKIQYTYQLEGVDEAYSQPTYLREESYRDLGPGNYTFKVKACNYNGTCTNEPVVFEFSIQAPYWTTWWFWIICIGALFGIFYFIIELRERNLKRSQGILEQKVKTRTRALMAQKRIIEQKNQHITDSIRYAQRIQEAIFPADEEFHKLFPRSFVLLKPKDIVSGDFYWTATVGDIHLVAAVDCTGHGVPGAMMSMLGYSLLNEIVLKKQISDPGQILDELRDGVIRSLRQRGREGETKDGMDIALCAIDTTNKILKYAGANNPLYMIDAEIQETKANKQPIGISPTGELIPFTTHTFGLVPNRSFYIFSDGYPDQFGGPSTKKFKYSRFRALLLSIQQEPMKKQKEILDKQIEDWRGDLEQIDDICVIGLKF